MITDIMSEFELNEIRRHIEERRVIERHIRSRVLGKEVRFTRGKFSGRIAIVKNIHINESRTYDEDWSILLYAPPLKLRNISFEGDYLNCNDARSYHPLNWFEFVGS